MGYVVVDPVVGAICAAIKFHFIDADPNYIVGRSWMQKYAVVCSSYH